jgi:NTP pyrophosphatase (non-canonical NTP hydrolase)
MNKLRDEIHQNAVEHGWWQEERSFGEIIALCHSELSEALEEYRNGHEPDELYFRDKDNPNIEIYGGDWDGINKPEGVAIELADCIIRILDYCGKAGIDIEEAIRIKHEYNKTRPHRHGGKKI